MPLLTKVEEKSEDGSFLINDHTRVAFVLEPPSTYLHDKVYALESPPFKVRVRCSHQGNKSHNLDVPWCYFVAATSKGGLVSQGHTTMWFAAKKLSALDGKVSMPPCLNILRTGLICHGNLEVAQSGSIENRLRQLFHHFWGSKFTPSTSGMKLIPSGFDRNLIRWDAEKIFAEWQRMNEEGKKIRWKGFRRHWRARTIKTLEEAMLFTFKGY